MGIPKFYKWLHRKYPLSVGKVNREEDVPPIDNLYIDMNGIVHMCVHGNSIEKHVLTSQMVSSGHTEELWCEIFKYLDDLIHLVNPRKFLFIALDSVTPVAKMTQQRARRMRDLHGCEEMAAISKLYGECELFDLNAISPGTEFMYQLNQKVDFFIKRKVNEDPLYQKIKIIFSNSNVPGEGEHKIMEFLRYYKHSPEYNPNTRHCIYGNDADLIMLALVSHEPNMIIFREIIEQKPMNVKATKGITRPILLKSPEYEILYVSVLREYFELEYASLKPHLQFPFDIERIIDDFIFFSLFVGNDFVPYLYTVDINYGSLDEIIRIYKQSLPKMKDYIMNKGEIQWSCAERILKKIGESELTKFQERLAESNKALQTGAAKVDLDVDKSSYKEKALLEKKREKIEELKTDGKLQEYIEFLKAKGQIANDGEDLDPSDIPDSDVSSVEDEDLPVVQEEIINTEEVHSVESNRAFLEKFCGTYESNIPEAKRIYYKLKLQFDIAESDGLAKLDTLIYKYLEGLQWVLYYYYKGVKHWGWYYPYHYAPLVSDISTPQKYFKENEPLTFSHLKEMNKPVNPFEQLLCILPEDSKNLLPQPYHMLYDGTSEIIDLYPKAYETDYNGRVLPWEAIKLIPFVDLNRVLDAERKALEKTGYKFSETEIIRNTISIPYEYVYMKSAKCGSVSTDMKDFPSLETSCCLKQEFKYFELPPGKFLCFLPEIDPRAELPCYDFPSLKYVPVEGCSIIQVPQNDIDYDCIELRLKEAPEIKPEELLNNPVFIGYPFQKEAIVDTVMTKKGIFSLSKDRSKVVRAESFNPGLFKKAVGLMWENRVSCRGEPKFVCECRIIDHVMKDFMEGGVYKKEPSINRTLVHSSLIMLKRDQKHYLNVDEWLQNISKQYQAGTNCLILAEPNFGSIGQIAQSSQGSGSISCILRRAVKRDVVSELLQISSMPENPHTSFVPMSYAATDLQLSFYTLSKLLSTVIVAGKRKAVEKKKPQGIMVPETRYNLGLCLREKKDGVHIPHHVFYDIKHKEWMLSKEIISCLHEYKKLCPHLFEILAEQENRGSAEKIFADMLFPESKDPLVPLNDLIGWLLSLPFSKLPFIPNNSRLMSTEMHFNLAKKLKFTSDSQPELSLVNCRTREVFVETYPFWVRPFGNRTASEFQIGDRVISIKTHGCGYVPFGSTGTIVGIYYNKIMVEFDKPLLTGSSCYDQCAKYCGKLVDSHALLNITMKRRVVPKSNFPGAPRQYSTGGYPRGQGPRYQDQRPPHMRPRMQGGPGPRGDSRDYYNNPPQIRPRKR